MNFFDLLILIIKIIVIAKAIISTAITVIDIVILLLPFFILFLHYLLFKHAIPGKIFPSKNSKEAPPPVEI